ncbi:MULTISPECIES: hypothetical protein [Bacillus cereus group]|uniref:hypothetical protein n=1 Tax=Bacillus cereus group TaxID=86661 RepID=UPI0022E86248|nr:hypothetical protein [Bacillus cereus group sp. TH152-1LC]MDA1675156.1 hypothetical protein [Bacillus cereus group sp. TH152-1LC]
MKKIKVVHVLIGISAVIWALFWYGYATATQEKDSKVLNQNTQKHVGSSVKEGKDDVAEKHHIDEEQTK